MALLRCVEAFAYTDHRSGQNRVVRTGDLVDDKDARVKGREQWFETVDGSAEVYTTRGDEPAPAKTRRAAKKAAGDSE
jgi:hypothetical protein